MIFWKIYIWAISAAFIFVSVTDFYVTGIVEMVFFAGIIAALYQYAYNGKKVFSMSWVVFFVAAIILTLSLDLTNLVETKKELASFQEKFMDVLDFLFGVPLLVFLIKVTVDSINVTKDKGFYWRIYFWVIAINQVIVSMTNFDMFAIASLISFSLILFCMYQYAYKHRKEFSLFWVIAFVIFIVIASIDDILVLFDVYRDPGSYKENFLEIFSTFVYLPTYIFLVIICKDNINRIINHEEPNAYLKLKDDVDNS